MRSGNERRDAQDQQGMANTKDWLNELYLNTGLNEGQEWLGIFHIETKVEFTVLGDTINHAARLSFSLQRRHLGYQNICSASFLPKPGNAYSSAFVARMQKDVKYLLRHPIPVLPSCWVQIALTMKSCMTSPPCPLQKL